MGVGARKRSAPKQASWFRSIRGVIAGGCRDSMTSGSRGLPDEACKVEGVGENIAHVVGFGTVVETKPGRTLEVAARLVGVSTLGITLAAQAQGPGRGIDLEISG